MPDLETAFKREVLRTYEEARIELHYSATYWLQMMGVYGPVGAAKQLVGTHPVGSAGLTRLWQEGRLDLTVEATMLRPAFAPLFTAAELARARELLAMYHYRAPWDTAPASPHAPEGPAT